MQRNLTFLTIFGLFFTSAWSGQTSTQSLPSLIENILLEHPSIKAERSLVQVSESAVESARWQYFPTPSISTEMAKSRDSDISYGRGSNSVTTLRLQQPLWTGGRLTAGVSKAEAGVIATSAHSESVRQDLTLRIVQIYSDWYGAYLKGLSFQKSLDVHVLLRDQISRRITEGISAASDFTLLIGREQQTAADLAAVKSQQINSLARLSQLAGREVAANELIASIVPALPIHEALPQLIEQAKAENPSVTRAIAQAKIYDAEISERKADLSPEVYARLDRQYGNFSDKNSAPQNRVFIGFQTKFGAGFSAISSIEGAKARYSASLADVESTRVGLGEQIVSDYSLNNSGKERLVLLTESLDSSESIRVAWGRQFLAGRKTWLDVMNATRELAQVEAQVAEVKASQILLTWRILVVVKGVDISLMEHSKLSTEAIK